MADKTFPNLMHAMDGSAPPVAGDELREIFDALDHGLCVIEVQFGADGRCSDYVFLELNDAFARQTGLRDAIGQSVRRLVPDHEEHWFETYGEIARGGVPKRFTAQAAALGRWYDVYAFRVGDPEGRRVAVLFEDISEKRRMEERHVLASRENEHRARNLFQMFEGIIRLTREETAEQFRAVLLRRVRGLLASHDIGFGTNALSELSELARHELMPYQSGTGRIAASGPAVMLDEAMAHCLSMILHELATNGLKYGALSVADGRVGLDWHVDCGTLRLRWTESGGPDVTPPAKSGFGSYVIERCVREQLRGEIVTRWHRSGVEHELSLPLPAMSRAD